MRVFTPCSIFTVFCLAFVANTTLQAQVFVISGDNNPIILDGHQQRHTLAPQSEHQLLIFQNLIPNQTYALIAPEDPNSGFCTPDVTAVDPATQVLGYNAAAHQLRFVASAAEMQFRLDYYCTWDPANPPSQYVSLECQTCVKKSLKEYIADMAVIEVSGGTADDLIRNVLIGGDCFDVTGVTFDGQGGQIGSFSQGLTNVGFATGMIMATGDIGVAVGPNNQDNASAGYGIATPDGDLATLSGGSIFDRAGIEFDFTPTQSPLTFNYVFASEEYCEYVNTQFNDVFGFFISGPGFAGSQNIAVLGGGVPVAINTVNHLTNSGLYVNNTPAGGTLCGQAASFLPSTNELQFDGYTRQLVASAPVQTCQTYHIKLKIGDVGDGIFDSAVFVKAGSFDAGGNASVEWVVNGDPDAEETFEGCGTVQLIFRRVGSNPNVPLVVQYTITGTATPGADYSPIPFTVVIPSGQTMVTINVNILIDALLEGQESIIITLNNPCSCLHPQEILLINDLPVLIAVPDTVTICSGGFAVLNVDVTSGVEPYTYSWQNGSTTSQISVFANVSTNYKVTVTDACGKTFVATARVIVSPPPIAQLLGPAPQLCPGQTITLMVNFTGTGPFTLNYNFNTIPQQPITDILDDPYPFVISQPGIYQVTGVTDGFGCTGPGGGVVIVVLSTINLTGVVSNVSCTGLANGSINTTVSGGQAPFTYTWNGPSFIGNVADPTGLNAGNYTVTLTDNSGCQHLQQFIINQPTALVPTIAGSVGPNCANPNGGSINLSVSGGSPNYTYLWNNGQAVQDPQGLGVGTYTVTVTDQAGCTKTTNATVAGDFVPPVAVANVADTITCITPSLTLNGNGSSTGPNFLYNWTANPGTITLGQGTLNPTVSSGGNYTLLVTNQTNGCTSTQSVTVPSNATPPTANAGPNQTLTCVLLTTNLNGSGSSQGGNFIYNWTASQGGTISGSNTVINPTATTTGLYTLLVTNTSNGCTSTASVNVGQNITPPVATVAPGGQLNCTTPTLVLNGTGSSTGPNFIYDWSSSTGGGISGNGNTLNPSVTAAGVYTLTVTNNSTGCTSTASASVSSNADIPTAIATPDGILTCADQQVLVDALGSSSGAGFTYIWSTTNGQILNGQGTLQINVDLPGMYTLVVNNTTNNCSSTFNVDVVQDVAAPVADAGNGQILDCTVLSLVLDASNSSAGAIFTYQWSTTGGGNFITPTNIVNPGIDAPGTYQITVTNTQNGCTSTDNVQITADANDPVVVIAMPAMLNCATQQTTLNATGSSTGANITYSWTGPSIVSGINSLNANVDAPGDYVLIITNMTNGCTSDQTVTVNQNIVAPPVDAGPDNLLNCTSPQDQLGGPGNPVGPNFTFNWTGAGIVSGPTTPNPTVNQGGTFTVVVTDLVNGCTSTDNVTVSTDFTPPQANAGPVFTLTCNQLQYVLNATASQGANFTYLWTTDTGNFLDPISIINPTVNAAGLYTLLVTNTTNGCTSTSSVQITKAADVPVAIAATPATLTCAVISVPLNGAGSSAGPGFTYQWTGGNILNGPTTLTPTVNMPGTYTLAVTNTTNNCTSTFDVTVPQNVATPTINAGPPQTLTCAAPTAQLNGSVGTGGTFTYLWQAQGAGNIVNGSTTLTPTVNAIGTYVLTVTSQQNGCTSVANVTVGANQTPPIALISAPATLTCAVQQISLDATASSNGGMTYQWTTNGGQIVNVTDPTQPVVDEPGIYTLLITDNVNGCTQTASVTVPQNIQNPVANAGANDLLTCAKTFLLLDGAGSSPNSSYLWTTQTGTISGSNTILTPTVTAGGTYVLVVTDNVNGCTSTDNTIVTVNTTPPTVSVSAPAVLTCIQTQAPLNGSGSQVGPGITYTWTTQGGNIVGPANGNQAMANAPGSYTLLVTNTATGCTNSSTVAVTENVVLPAVDAGPPFTLTCSVLQVSLQGSGSAGTGYTYSWTTPTGTIVSGNNTPTPLVSEEGTYNLLVTNTSTGCKNTDQVLVFKETNIPTGFLVDLEEPSCKDNDGLITFGAVAGGFGPYLYSIDGGQTFVSNLDFANIPSGNYDLWIQDFNGCEFHKLLTVPKAPLPNITIAPEFNIVLGDSVDLHAILPAGYPLAQIDTIIWTPLDGLTFDGNDIFSLLNPNAKPFKPTEYTVTIISGDGCEDQAKVLIRVDTEPHVYIPNVFSPWDGNNENDIVYIFADGYQVVKINKFQIFDRWGEMVYQAANFQPNDPAYGWDGRLGGKMQTPGVFVYYAEVLMIDGRIILLKGDITLLR